MEAGTNSLLLRLMMMRLCFFILDKSSCLLSLSLILDQLLHGARQGERSFMSLCVPVRRSRRRFDTRSGGIRCQDDSRDGRRFVALLYGGLTAAACIEEITGRYYSNSVCTANNLHNLHNLHNLNNLNHLHTIRDGQGLRGLTAKSTD